MNVCIDIFIDILTKCWHSTSNPTHDCVMDFFNRSFIQWQVSFDIRMYICILIKFPHSTTNRTHDCVMGLFCRTLFIMTGTFWSVYICTHIYIYQQMLKLSEQPCTWLCHRSYLSVSFHKCRTLLTFVYMRTKCRQSMSTSLHACVKGLFCRSLFKTMGLFWHIYTNTSI